MPIFFQQDIDESTKLAVWKIEEEEDFFLQHVPLQREITHPHKRLQHLAGRYLLQYLFPDFPISLIKIADTRKPFLEDEAYHFSISHCSNYAAAIVSKDKRVGVDIEVPTPKVEKIMHKFLHDDEINWFRKAGAIGNVQLINAGKADNFQLLADQSFYLLTLLWSSKEAMFKWWGLGDVDFKTMLRLEGDKLQDGLPLTGNFCKDADNVFYPIHWKRFAGLVLTWVVTDPHIA